MLIKKVFSFFPPIFYSALLLFIIGLFVFNKTFHLSLMGDEWQMIWVIKGSLQTTGHWDAGIKQFNWQGYQFGALLMHLLTKYFGYDGKAVYIFSYITRFFATLALFYFLIRRGSSRKVAFLGSLFFLITPVGIQATDWAKNFTSYISIAFFLICIDSSFGLKSWKSVLIFILTFAISIYVNAIRAPGIVLTILFILILHIFLEKSGAKKKIVASFIGLVLIFLLFSKLLIFANVGSLQNYYIKQSSLILNQILIGNMDRIVSIFVLIGRGILPEPSLMYILLLATVLLFWKRYLFDRKYFSITLIIHAVLVYGILFIFPSSKENMTAILGIYFTIFILTTFAVEILSKKIEEAAETILPFILNIAFILTAWIFGNTDVTQSTHRYLIYPALSIPIILAFSLKQNNFLDFKTVLLRPFKINSIIFYAIVAFLLMSFFSIKGEINNMFINHNQDTSKLLWGQITPFFDDFDFKHHRPIILFESDNPAILHDTILFGIDYKLGLLYKIWEEDKLPIPVDGVETLKSMLTDGKASERYTGKEMVFPGEDAFYFQIKGDKVIRIDISTL